MGADLRPLGQRLRVLHPERLDSTTIDALRRMKPAVLRAFAAELAAAAIVYACAARDSRPIGPVACRPAAPRRGYRLLVSFAPRLAWLAFQAWPRGESHRWVTAPVLFSNIF